ncbi:hypothetical protein [Gloeomargarita lithophora]|uniref:hypothetical protein n=1 Tax=Gloeomargarita lithophora TaxID=1188228 RepID=UPI00155FE86C|nr:hypothetical protein [Gloeomargarita lithophora]
MFIPRGTPVNLWPWRNSPDPERLLEQWVNHLHRQLRQVKRAVALMVATQRRLRRQLQRAVCPQIRQELQQALAHQSVHCRQLQQQLLHLEQQVQALQARREVLTARASTATARKAICDLRQHITDGTLPTVLGDTEEWVHRLEAEVELWEHSLGEYAPSLSQR